MSGPLVNFGDVRLPDRLWSKVAPCPMSGCWLWTASLKPQGYGEITMDGRLRYAHRVSYETLVGDIPPGLELDHLCRVRSCVNPAHLEPVTHRENARRGSTGLATGARQRAKTACPAGHPYAGDNLTVLRSGERSCRACRRARWHRGAEARS